MTSSNAYRAAGVDLEEAQRTLQAIRNPVESTYTPGVLRRPGLFAGFFGWPDPTGDRLLVSSMDGVGTKMRVAALAGRFRDPGYDIVSHCVNDILVHAARPLFFLDYVGTGKLSSEVMRELLEGMAEACREAGCALIGGETAEMPGVYAAGDWEVVGTIIGEVRRSELVDGSAIRAGDRLLALRSNGLHTNGYSLARRILGIDETPSVLEERLVPNGPTLADLLLARHRMYLGLAGPLLRDPGLHGMVHLTGGGLPENVPRILPHGCRAVVDPNRWEVPELFRHLVEEGHVPFEESYRVFNMGLGFVFVVSPERAAALSEQLAELGERPREIGWIEEGDRGFRFGGAAESATKLPTGDRE